jgi:hypothetical protein
MIAIISSFLLINNIIYNTHQNKNNNKEMFTKAIPINL